MVDKNVPASPFAPDKNPCIVLRYGKETGGILLNPSGSNGLHDIKIRNIIRIREMIFRNYPICRVDLAETLGVTLPTVTTNIKSMLREGFIIEKKPSGHASVGRTPSLIEPNPDYGLIAGMEINPYRAVLVVSDITGRVIDRASFRLSSYSYDAMAGQVASYASSFLIPYRERVLGFSIALPGLIDEDSGTIRRSSNEDWNGKRLADDLSAMIGVPTIVENNVKARVIAYDLFSREPEHDWFSYYFIFKGIGCFMAESYPDSLCTVIGSGEVGHSIVDPEGPACPTCGKRGCLESIAGEKAIISECERLIANGDIDDIGLSGDPYDDFPRIIAEADSGNGIIRRVLENAYGYLALSISNVINFTSPELMIIESRLFNSSEAREHLRSLIFKNTYGITESDVHIEFVDYDEYSGAVGAVAVGLRSFIIQKSCEKLERPSSGKPS